MNTIFIGLGSNLGNRERQIDCALECISKLEHSRLLHVSSLYETSPVSTIKQGPFLNAVCQISSSLSPFELLTSLQALETRLGKKVTVKDGPRAIDLDILFFEDRIVNDTHLHIPHPRIGERLFVLVPLLELLNFPETLVTWRVTAELIPDKLGTPLKDQVQKRIADLCQTTDQIVLPYKIVK